MTHHSAAGTIQQAIGLIKHHINGFVPFTSDSKVRTTVHALLFHYEYLFIPKMPQKIILFSKGSTPCTQAPFCPYVLAYTLITRYVSQVLKYDLPNMPSCGCTFGHDQLEDLGWVDELLPMVDEGFFAGLHAILFTQSHRPRETKPYKCALGQNRFHFVQLRRCDDSIFVHSVGHACAHMGVPFEEPDEPTGEPSEVPQMGPVVDPYYGPIIDMPDDHPMPATKVVPNVSPVERHLGVPVVDDQRFPSLTELYMPGV